MYGAVNFRIAAMLSTLLGLLSLGCTRNDGQSTSGNVGSDAEKPVESAELQVQADAIAAAAQLAAEQAARPQTASEARN
jgi:hypothetical protein